MENKSHIYNQNIHALNKRDWNIPHIESTYVKDYRLSLTDSKEGIPTLLMQINDKEYYLHSKYRPIDEAKRLTEKVNNTTQNIVVFGLGLGYHTKEILKKVSNEARVIVIVPNYSIFLNLLNLTDFTDIISDERFYLTVYENKGKTKAFLKKYLNWKKINSIEFLHIVNYKNIFSEALEESIRCLRESVTLNNIEENTTVYCSEDWQKNYFQNLPRIFESTPITYFANQFMNVPAVIVSAGPSLNKNVQMLKDMKDNVLILSTDTALKVLLKNDIKPHLVFSVDGSLLNFKKFSDIEYDNIPLVFHSMTYKRILDNHKGDKIFFTKCDYIYNLFKEKDLDTWIPIGGSVATAAFSMACYAGANPVIFIGQDLAFTEEKTHAEGTMYDENAFKERHQNKLKEKTQKHYVKVKGNYEKEVLTDPVYKSFLVWFQDAIEMEKDNRKFINATEGGAFIAGTDVLTLEETKSIYCKESHPIEEKIQSILNKEKPFSTEELQNLLLDHNNARVELDVIKKKANLACKYISEIIEIYKENKVNSKSIQQYIKKLDKIDEYIKKQKQSTVFIEIIVQKNIVESDFRLYRLEKQNETQQEAGIRIMEGNELLYKGIVASIESVEYMMDEYLDKMKENLGGKFNGS